MENIENQFPTLSEVESVYFSDLMYLVGDDIERACKLSGLSRPTLFKKLKKYKLHIYKELVQ